MIIDKNMKRIEMQYLPILENVAYYTSSFYAKWNTPTTMQTTVTNKDTSILANE